MGGQNRHSHRWSDAVGGDEHAERRSFVALEEPEESLRVLANVMVHVQERGRSRLEFGQCARCDVNEISDSPDLDERETVGHALDHGSAQASDHGCTPRAARTRSRVGATAR